jgi:DNA ligase-1
MIRFAELYARLDATTRTAEKVDALKAYFREAPPQDAAWAAYLLLGRKIGRTVSSKLIREWAAEATGFAPWLIEECNHVAGDFSETLSLLLPPPSLPDPPSLHEVIEDHLQACGTACKAGSDMCCTSCSAARSVSAFPGFS